MRKTAIAACIIALVLIFSALLLPRLISLDSIKPRIVSALEEKTGRRVSLSDLSLSLFPGIGVRIIGLEVSGDPGHSGEPLLSVPEGLVRVAIVPLFSGRAEFTKIVLRRPTIHFRIYRDGTHSATDIARMLGKGEEPGKAAPPVLAEEEKVRVVLKSVEIEDGAFSLRIEEKGGRVTPWEISPVSLRLSGIGQQRNEFAFRTRLEGTVRGEIAFAGKSIRVHGKGAESDAFDFTGEGTIFGQKATAEGKVSSPRGATEVDLAFSFPKIEMGMVPGIWKDPPPSLASARLEGVASLTGNVSGALQSPEFQAKVDLTRAGWTIGGPPELRKPVDIPFTLDLLGRYAQDKVRVSHAALRAPHLHLDANAVMQPATGAREWEATTRIASLAELGRISGLGLSGYEPAGRLTISAKGKRSGTGGKEWYRIAVDLADAGFRVPERRVEFRSLSGRAEITPDAVKAIPLSGLLNGHRFSLKGDVALGAKSKGQVDFRIAYLDVDALFPPEEEGRKSEGKETPARKGGAETGKSEVSVRADLSIDAGKARGMEFQNLKGKVRYEGGTLFLDSVSARMYGGDVRLSGRVGFGAPAPDFQVKVAVKDLAAEEILSRKTTLKDFLAGPVSLSAEIGGGMKSFDDFARTGEGSGSVKITGGRIKGVDLLAKAAGLAGLGAIAPASPAGTAARAETKFTDLSADFRVENGKIRTEALTILAEKMGLTGEAAVGFDRTIDFRGTLHLSREMSERVGGKAGKFFIGEDGRVNIPLTVTGPLASPSVAIDPAALAKGVAGKVLRGLTDRISGSPPAAGADNAASATKPGKAEPIKEVEELFKKILPGK